MLVEQHCLGGKDKELWKKNFSIGVVGTVWTTGRGWVVECSKTEIIKCKRCDGATVIPWEAEIEMFRRKALEHDSWHFTVFANDEYTAKQVAVEHRSFLLKEGLWK